MAQTFTIKNIQNLPKCTFRSEVSRVKISSSVPDNYKKYLAQFNFMIYSQRNTVEQSSVKLIRNCQSRMSEFKRLVAEKCGSCCLKCEETADSNNQS